MSEFNQGSGLSQEDAAMLENVERIFNRVRDAFINASGLAKEVEALRGTVEALRNDVESYRQANVHLDQSLQEVRKERDNYQAALSESQRQVSSLHDEKYRLVNITNENSATISRLDAELTSTKSAKENAEIDLMYAQDRIKELTGIVDNMRKAMGLPPLPIWEAPRPQARPEPEPAAGQVADPPTYEDQSGDKTWSQGSQGQF